MISFGADGEGRLLTSMRVMSKLYNYTSKKYDYISLESGESLVGSVPKAWKSWFFIKVEEAVCFVQDTVQCAFGCETDNTVTYFITSFTNG